MPPGSTNQPPSGLCPPQFLWLKTVGAPSLAPEGWAPHVVRGHPCRTDTESPGQQGHRKYTHQRRASAPASSQNLSHGTSELIVHGALRNSPHTSDPPALLLFGIPREERKGPPSPPPLTPPSSAWPSSGHCSLRRWRKNRETWTSFQMRLWHCCKVSSLRIKAEYYLHSLSVPVTNCKSLSLSSVLSQVDGCHKPTRPWFANLER